MNPGETRQTLTVEDSEGGTRLDSFLGARVPELTRSAAARLIKEGRVLVDQSPRKAAHILSPGEAVTVVIPPPEPIEALPEDIPLTILYEDPHLVAVAKPPGLVVHPAAGHATGTLVNALLHHCRDLSGVGGALRPGIVHRLDKDTSGVLVAAKNDAAHQALSSQFAARTVEKEYAALVHGRPKAPRGTIEAPIARHPRDRKKMHAAKDGQGRSASTSWRVVREFPDAAFLSIQIHTGRTHQIRVHLSAIGHPVLGDPVYGSRKTLGKGAPRQMLHAKKLCIDHPVTGERLCFEAPLPDDMARLIKALEAGS